jgi:hypothetical protein
MKLTFSSGALIAATILATPAMACASHVISRHRARHASASAFPTASYMVDHLSFSAPRVSAFPSAPPPARENCDVGDNPFIC